MSHELRTPLTFVRGYTELFLEDAMGPLTEDQRQAIEVMAYRTDEVIRLVNNILAFQKMAVEEARREPVDVVALAREALHTAEIIEAQNRHSHAKHEFVLDAPDEVPPVLGDKEHLMQALDNLLSNAVKFSPEGGQITVRIRPVQHRFIWPGCEPQILPAVQISVSDQGVGIPADQIDRIWQRFYQVDGSSTRRFGGVGLGLAIVREVIENHFGIIWVESKEKQGTTFHIVLPTAEVKDKIPRRRNGSPDKKELDTPSEMPSLT
ncbi:MAG: hypothetical protein Kow0047_29000 [Anaerolineae bacterium]